MHDIATQSVHITWGSSDVTQHKRVFDVSMTLILWHINTSNTFMVGRNYYNT